MMVKFEVEGVVCREYNRNAGYDADFFVELSDGCAPTSLTDVLDQVAQDGKKVRITIEVLE